MTRLSISLPPYGILGIDPMVALPLITIPQPAGFASITYAFPNVPTFVGISIFAQALLLQIPIQERLTNVTADVLIR